MKAEGFTNIDSPTLYCDTERDGVLTSKGETK